MGKCQVKYETVLSSFFGFENSAETLAICLSDTKIHLSAYS